MLLNQMGEVRDFLNEISQKQSKDEGGTNPNDGIKKWESGNVCKKDTIEEKTCYVAGNLFKKHDAKRHASKK